MKTWKLRSLVAVAALSLVCGIVYAAQDTSITDREVRDPKQLKTWLESNATDVESRLTVDAGTALNVTNGQAVVMTGGIVFLNGIGGADDSTNTISVTGTIGSETTFIVAAASSNLITIADSGTVYLSSAWLGDNNDVIKLYVRTATTNIVQTGEEDN